MIDFLEAYLEYTARQVSPRQFHLWSAVAVIGGVLERKVWFWALKKFKLYPGQIMVVLVSKSAITKKSTAAQLAVEFTRTLEPWQFYLLPKKLSPQQLLKCLERLEPEEKVPMRDPDGRRVNGAGFIFARELGTFFTTEAFNEALATHINDLNDCPPGKIRLEFRSWKADLWQPCVSLLGCITPKGIAEELPKAARTAGSFGRVLWVFADHTTRRVSLADDPPPSDVELHRKLVRELEAIVTMRGEMHLSPKAKRWFNEWYHEIHEPKLRRAEMPESEQTGYWGRKDAHVLRVGMVRAASRSRGLVIRREDVQWALKEIETIEKSFPAAMAEIGTNPYNDFERVLLETLERYSSKSDWVDEQRLRQWLRRYGGDRRFTESRETLARAGEVDVKRQGDRWLWRRVYSTGRRIRGTEEER